MEYVCNNPNCAKFGVKEYLSSETFRFKDGKLVGVHAPCPCCGNVREEINPNKDIPLSEKNIGISLYNGMSVEQKREALKKRSHEHFQKEIKEKKDGLINKAVTEFSEMSKK